MEEITAEHFVSKFKRMLIEQEADFTFFLGAGCSISSGIPGAKTLVEQWLLKLHAEMEGGKGSFEEWRTREFPDFVPENPGASYAKVMRRLFGTSSERQNEIERIVLQRDPGFGYAVLAKLITQEDCGTRCNFVLTSNFDDMVADALYLYTQQKPLVIVHESLAGFVETGRSRPVIIKLHGDALLDPKNTERETAELPKDIRNVLKENLKKRNLVFLGYGGNDQGITKLLQSLPDDALSRGVYWVNDNIPDNDFGKWLQTKKGVFWIKHLRFDDLMLLMRSEFNLRHPDKKRFNKLLETYRETFELLSGKVDEMPESPSKEALRIAVNKAVIDATDWWGVELAARKVIKSNPVKADQIYLEGLEKFKNSPELLGNYALFLHSKKKDMRLAEEYYKRAMEADPKDTTTLGNFASFLYNEKKDMRLAEEYYKRAMEADPKDTHNLSNFAGFLYSEKKDMRLAEEYFKRAEEADPKNAHNLGRYASFLEEEKKDPKAAEEYYKRAVEADPKHALVLGKYASFLYSEKKDIGAAKEYYKRAIEADPKHVIILGNYAGILMAKGQSTEGMEFLKKALSLAEIPKHEPLVLECHFYRYANGTKKDRSEALARMKSRLTEGVRSKGWNFSANIERAEADGHPNVDFLNALAAVITEEADVSTLDGFTEWGEGS